MREVRGFFIPGNGEPGNGELTDNTFSLAETNMGSVSASHYAIEEIAVSSIDNALTFSMGGKRLSAAAERTLALHVCDETLDFKKATLDGGIYKFTGTGLDWSDQVTRKIYLSRDETAPQLLLGDADRHLAGADLQRGTWTKPREAPRRTPPLS